jgi:hypothetical protein
MQLWHIWDQHYRTVTHKDRSWSRMICWIWLNVKMWTFCCMICNFCTVFWVVFGMIPGRVEAASNYIFKYQYSSKTGTLKIEIWNLKILITACIVNNFIWERGQLSSASYEPSPIVLYLTCILQQGMVGSRWDLRHVTGSPRGGGIVLDFVIL